MEDKKLIASITIPNYIREVQLSKAQRPKYFEWDGKTIKAKGKKIWKKLIKTGINNTIVLPQDLTNNYALIGFKGRFLYCIRETVMTEFIVADLTAAQLKVKTKYLVCSIDQSNSKNIEYTPVIANPTQAGSPKMQVISGQSFYVGLNEFTRNKIVDELKRMYLKKAVSVNEKWDVLGSILNNHPPFIIECHIYDTIKAHNDKTKKGHGRRWDVGNRLDPYMKTFLDFLVTGYTDKETGVGIRGILKDDDRLHVTSANNGYFYPIEEGKTRKLVFKIYQDTREIWKTLKK